MNNTLKICVAEKITIVELLVCRSALIYWTPDKWEVYPFATVYGYLYMTKRVVQVQKMPPPVIDWNPALYSFSIGG